MGLVGATPTGWPVCLSGMLVKGSGLGLIGKIVVGIIGARYRRVIVGLIAFPLIGGASIGAVIGAAILLFYLAADQMIDAPIGPAPPILQLRASWRVRLLLLGCRASPQDLDRPTSNFSSRFLLRRNKIRVTLLPL